MLLLMILALALPGQSGADELRVATASNFRNAMVALVREFEQASGLAVEPVYGSTG